MTITSVVSQMPSRRLRLVECIDSFGAGGTELNCIRTIERLDRLEFDISIVVLNDDGRLRDRFINTGFPIKVFAFPRLNSLLAVQQAFFMTCWLRRSRPDIVHSHDRYTNLFVTPCARLAGVPLVISSRRWWTAMPRPIYKVGNQLAYHISDRIVANSAAVARLMTGAEGIPEARIITLPNFVDDDAFEPLPVAAVAEFRRRLGIPEQAVVVTFVAVFRPEKDVRSLVEAMAIATRSCPSLHLVLIGSGPCEAELRQSVDAHGLGGSVHFAGYMAGPPNPHAFGDIAVLCSLHEGFPNSIVEAMAAGKPVVATDVGGVPDAVDDGETGILVPPRSPEALAGGLRRLAEDASLRGTMGAAARKKARSAYAARPVLQKLTSMYREGCRL